MTTYVLPGNTLVHVTIYQFDGQSGLRNPFISQAQGTVGGSFLLNGKPTNTISPGRRLAHLRDPPARRLRATRGIPDSAKNPCNNAPCPLSTDH